MDKIEELAIQPEGVRPEIQKTRAGMDETIEEIEERLFSARSHLAENVKQNPWPYALIGTGLAAGIGGLIYYLARRKKEGEEMTKFSQVMESYAATEPCSVGCC